jgi:flagellar basal body-associated protein FliL
MGMEGGIGIFLLLIVVVVAVGGGVALYLTGGALWAKGSQSNDAPRSRPTHKTPMPPEQEHTHFVGTPEGDEAARRQRDAR